MKNRNDKNLSNQNLKFIEAKSSLKMKMRLMNQMYTQIRLFNSHGPNQLLHLPKI